MVESLSSRLWRTIPLILIVVLFSSLAYGEVIYVDDDATGANDGKNWENAYKHLQDALADAESAEKPVEIRVAQGIYKPDQGANQTPGDRVANFRLINGVTLEGSYAGFGHDDPNDRDVAGFITSDLAGEWFLGGSDIQGDHTWDGLLIIDSDGTITGGTLENSDGLTYTSISGDLTINDTGKVTGQVLYSNGIKILLTMQMNKSKGVVAGEGNEQIYKEDGVFIFVKTSSGFMTSDLEGEWFLSGSDIQGDHTWDGLVILNSEGKVAGGILESSDGPVYTFVGGDLAINSTGKVTGQITDSNGVTTQMTMQMDKSKGNIAGEGNAELDDQDGVFFFVKKTSGFTTSDLEGYWSLGGSDIQGDHTRDGFLLIDDEGNVIGGMIASSEGPVYTFIGGDLSINSTGKVIGQVTDSDGVTTQLTMHMNENKDIVAGEGNAQGDDEDGIFVFVRISSRYNTVLSGDLLGNDAVVDDPCDMLNEPNRADNSYHVVYGREVDSSAILDGFTVTGGKGLEGGGIYLSSHSEPTVSNCRFYANSAYRGGAIAISNVGKPTISNCMFISNSATTSGGAIYADDRGSAIVTNCIFIDNYAPFDGGAVYMSQICRQVYTDCMFLRNKAGAGGAIVDRYANVTTYVRCSFIENSATTSGGAYHLGSLREENFTDCSFVRNESNHSGGGVTIWGGKANFTRCIFHENTSSNGGGLHFTSCMYRSTIEDCEFIKNTTSAL